MGTAFSQPPYFPGNLQITNIDIVNTTQIGDAVGTSDPGPPGPISAAPADNDLLQINSGTQIGTPAQNRRLAVYGPVLLAGAVTFLKGAASTITVDGATTPHTGADDFFVTEARAAGAAAEQRAARVLYNSNGTLGAAQEGHALVLELQDAAGDNAAGFLTAEVIRHPAAEAVAGIFKTAIAIEDAARWDNALLINVDNTIDIGLAAAGGPYGTRGRARTVYVGTSVVVGGTATLDTDSLLFTGVAAVDATAQDATLVVRTTRATDGAGGNLSITGANGQATAGVVAFTGSTVAITSGSAAAFGVGPASAAGAPLTILAGSAARVGAAAAAGGTISITAGNGAADVGLAGNGGPINITAGDGEASGTGGGLAFRSGNSAGAAGTAGSISIVNGTPAGGTPGTIALGDANGGAITIRNGAGNINVIPAASIVVDPLAAGVIVDFTLEAVMTSGTVIRGDYAAGPTILLAALTGLNFDFTTNVTPGAIQVNGVVLNIPATTSAAATAISVTDTQTQGNVVSLDINSVVGAAGLQGLLIDADGVNAAAGNFVALHVDMDGAAGLGAGDVGILIDVPAGIRAIRIQDGSIDWVAGAADTFVIEPTATGLVIFDFQLETEFTGGTLFRADYGAGPTVLAAALTGLTFDFTTNVTPGAIQVNGIVLNIPATTSAAATAISVTDTQTQGSVVSLDVNSVVGAGGLNGILVDGDGVNNGANAFRAVQVDLDGMTVGAGILRPVSILLPQAIAGTVQAVFIDETNLTMVGGNSARTGYRDIRTLTNTGAVARTVTGSFFDIDYVVENTNAGGSLTATLNLINFLVTPTQTAGALRVDGNVISLVLDGIVTGNHAGLFILSSNDVVTAGGVFSGIELDLSPMPVGGGTMRGIFVQMPDPYGAGTEIGIRVTGDGRAINIATDTHAIYSNGAIQIDAVAAETQLDFVLEAQQTSGTVINADYAAGPTVLLAALNGIVFDFTTNVTPGAIDVIGVNLTIPATTSAAARAITITDTQTQGSVVSLDINSVVGAGGLNGILVDGDGVNAAGGTFYGVFVNMDGAAGLGADDAGIRIEVPAGINAISIGDGSVDWDMGATDTLDIDAAAVVRTGTTPVVNINASIDTTVAGDNVSAVNLAVTRAALDTGRTTGYQVELLVAGAYAPAAEEPRPAVAGYRVILDASWSRTAGAGLVTTPFAVDYRPAQDAGISSMHYGYFDSSNLTAPSVALIGGFGGRIRHNTAVPANTIGEMDGFEMGFSVSAGNTSGELYGLLLWDTGTGLDGTITGNVQVIWSNWTTGTGTVTGDWLGWFNQVDLSGMTITGGDFFGIDQILTGGANTLRIWGESIDLNGVQPAAGVWRGAYVDIDGVTPNATGTVVGYDLQATAIPVAAAGAAIIGARIQFPAAYGAATENVMVLTGDGRTVNVLSDDAAIELGATSTTDAAARSVTDDRGLLGTPDRRFSSAYMASPPIIEDFEGGTAVADFTSRWAFGGNLAPTVVLSGEGGIIELVTPAVNTQTSVMTSKGSNWSRDVTRAVEWVARAVAAGDITDVRVRVGMTSDPAFGGATNGLVAEFDTTGANPGTWVLVGYSAGARVVGVPGVAIPPVNGVDQRIEVRPAANGSGTLFIAGTQRTTVAAAAMGGGACQLIVYVRTEFAGGAAKTWRADTATWRRVPIA